MLGLDFEMTIDNTWASLQSATTFPQVYLLIGSPLIALENKMILHLYTSGQ